MKEQEKLKQEISKRLEDKNWNQKIAGNVISRNKMQRNKNIASVSMAILILGLAFGTYSYLSQEDTIAETLHQESFAYALEEALND